MRLGIGSYAYRWALGTETFRPAQPATVADLVRDAAQMGVDVLQVADSAELEAAPDSALTELLALARDLGIRFQTGTTGAHPEQLARHIHIARILEADVVRVVLDDGADPGPEVEALRAVLPQLDEHGLTVGIENHFTMTSPRILEVLEQLDHVRVGVVLDVANSIMCQEWPAQTIDQLAPHAVCVHLKDCRLEPDPEGVGGHVVGTPLGTGVVDLPAALAAVRARDDGELAVILEQWAPRLPGIEETLKLEQEWRRAAVDHARGSLHIGGGARR